MEGRGLGAKILIPTGFGRDDPNPVRTLGHPSLQTHTKMIRLREVVDDLIHQTLKDEPGDGEILFSLFLF